MAFLMLLCQKMKLQREENRLTLEQMRFSSKVDRMEKKVGKRQKYYDKLKKQLERQANCYKNSMNMQISNMFGLGTNSVNLSNPYGANGAAMSILAGMNADQMNKALGLTADSTKTGGFTINDDLADAIKSGCLQIAQSDIDDKNIKKGQLYNPYTMKPIEGVKEEQIQAASQAYQQLQQMAQMQVTNMQTQATQMKSAYENNVSIWLEAQTEQLEAQEEWEMDLLAEEQADMEADKNMVEAKLKRVQQEKQNIEQALGQAIQDSAPKFGLG